jgi:hypothetical protein
MAIQKAKEVMRKTSGLRRKEIVFPCNYKEFPFLRRCKMRKYFVLILALLLMIAFTVPAGAGSTKKYPQGLTFAFKDGKGTKPGIATVHYENEWPHTWGPEYEKCTNEKSLIHAVANAIEVQGDQIWSMEVCRFSDWGGFFCEFMDFYYNPCTGYFTAHQTMPMIPLEDIQLRFNRWEDPATYWEAFSKKNYHNRLRLKGMCLSEHADTDKCFNCPTVTWRVSPGPCNWNPAKDMSEDNCPF